jgi:hypothetical protein
MDLSDEEAQRILAIVNKSLQEVSGGSQG